MTKCSSKLSFAALAAMVAAGLVAPALGSAATAQSAESTAPSSERSTTYTWSAELVAFDAASNVATVRALVVSHPQNPDLTKLRAGERAMLTWSGVTIGSGVRAVERGNSSSFDRMTMPIEFVAAELDGRYVTFKVPVPAADSAAIAKLRPGMYVTATSPWVTKDASEAVMSIKSYSDVS